MFEGIYVCYIKAFFPRYNAYKPDYRIMKMLTTYYLICAEMEVEKKKKCVG